MASKRMDLDPKQKSIYTLRSILDQANYRIHQVEQETGLQLSHYLIEDEGFRAIDLDTIVELDDASHPTYEFYAYHRIGRLDYCDRIQDALYELRSIYETRADILPLYQQAWDNSRNHGEGVKIHYGLRSVVLSIPIETLVKYQIFLDLSVRRNNFDRRTGRLDFFFGWYDSSVNVFDSMLRFLEWKVTEYHRRHEDREEIANFLCQCEGFRLWEDATFTAPAST